MSAFAATTSFFSRSATVLTRIGRTARRLVTSNRVVPPPRCCAATGAAIVRVATAPMARNVTLRITALLTHHCVAFVRGGVRTPEKLLAYQDWLRPAYPDWAVQP